MSSNLNTAFKLACLFLFSSLIKQKPTFFEKKKQVSQKQYVIFIQGNIKPSPVKEINSKTQACAAAFGAVSALFSGLSCRGGDSGFFSAVAFSLFSMAATASMKSAAWAGSSLSSGE